jgi:gluconate kinase
VGLRDVARRNYLVEGLSGTGKSAVHDELLRRGHHAVSTDRAWAHFVDPATGLPGGPVHHDSWMWDRATAVRELERPDPEVLFVCGSSRNRDEFIPYFTKVFNLRVDDDTLRRRLEARSEADWAMGREGVELALALNQTDQGPPGAIHLDATQPLDQLVDQLLRLAT